MYLLKLQNSGLRLNNEDRRSKRCGKCTYLPKVPKVLVQGGICICPNDEMCLYRKLNVLVEVMYKTEGLKVQGQSEFGLNNKDRRSVLCAKKRNARRHSGW